MTSLTPSALFGLARAIRLPLILAALAATPCVPMVVAADSAPAAATPAASSAANGSEQSAAPADSAVAPQRVAVIADEATRSRDYASTLAGDESIWLEAGSDRSLALFRPVVRGEPRGVVVVVLAPGLGPESGSTSVALRHAFPRHGWATLLVRLPDVSDRAPVAPTAAAGTATDAAPANAAPDAQTSVAESAERATIRVRLDAAMSVARQRSPKGAVIVFAEGTAAAWTIWAQRNGLAASAIVAVDVDGRTPVIESARPAEHLKAVTGPALVLIEAPRAWSPDDALSPETELHLLPADNPASERVERVLRGWIKRRLSEPASPSVAERP